MNNSSEQQPRKSPKVDLRQEMIESYSEFERGFRKNYPLTWWGTLLSPIVVTSTLLIGIGVIWDFELTGKFIFAAVSTFFLFGRFVIIMGGDQEQLAGTWMEGVNLEPEQLFGMVTAMDVITALFVTFHLGFLFNVPWLGPRVSALVWDGKFLIERQPWIRRVAFIGLILFVIFPSSTTGSIGGSIFGRLLGLGRLWTIIGVLVGSLLGNGLMLYFANFINDHLGQDSIIVKSSGVVIILLIGVFLGWRYKKAKARFLAMELEMEAGDEDSSTEPEVKDS